MIIADINDTPMDYSKALSMTQEERLEAIEKLNAEILKKRKMTSEVSKHYGKDSELSVKK